MDPETDQSLSPLVGHALLQSEKAASATPVVDYYDYCHKDYKRMWHLDQCMAMHMGFWDKGIKKLKDALIRENEVLAEMAGIRSTDRVLDAGCGVGGSSIYLAKTIGCQVSGITLSTQQVEHAKAYARKQQVEDLTDFQVADFTDTPFDPESFDVVWAIESVCHAPDKGDFLKEAYRLLKPGGRLILADGFQFKPDLSVKERDLLQHSFMGWGVEGVERNDRFHQEMGENGFRNIVEEDATDRIYRSSFWLYFLSFPAYFVDMYGRMLKQRGPVEQMSVVAARKQYLSLRKGLWKYRIFYGEK